MWPETYNIHVSRETLDKLTLYQKLLMKWQKAINLVSPSTLQQSGIRHFADSAQLNVHLPKNAKTLVDLGSGAGFPGLVLAILNPQTEVHLIESDTRKCEFMRTVSRETETPVTLHAERIEKILPQMQADILTARALADLKTLLGYATQMKKTPFCLFQKGERAQAEIEEARQNFDFEADSVTSLTDPKAQILKISDLKTRV